MGQKSSTKATSKFGYFVSGFFLLLVLVIAFQIHASYRAAQNAARSDVQNLVRVLESKLSTDFVAAVRAVTYVAGQIPAEAMTDGKSAAGVTQLLKSQVRSVSSASAMRVFAANGDRLYTSLDNETAINVADRAFFRKLKDDPNQELIFSEVVLGRYTKRATMYVSKPIRSRRGEFLGLVLTAIDLNAIHDQFEQLKLGNEGVIALRRIDDGALVVRYPGAVEIDNAPVPNIPLLEVLRTGNTAGTMEITSLVDSVRRLYGYRVVAETPLFISVGIAEQDYLAEWRQQTLIIGTTLLIMLAALIVMLKKQKNSEYATQFAESRLSDSEDRFRTLFSHNHAIILQIDPESGLIIDANAAASDFYGWSIEQLCGMNIADINQLDAAQIAAERIAAVNEQRNYFVFPHKLATGEVRTVEVHSTPIPVGEKTVLVSIIHDITDRLDREKQISNLLQEQKAILNSHVVGIVKVMGRHIVWSNDAFAEILGYTTDELMGQPTRIFYPNDEDYEAIGRTAYQVVQAGKVFRAENQLRRKDGSLAWYQLGGSLLHPNSKESIWVFVNINDRKLLEVELEKHSQHLEQLVEDRTAALSVAKDAAEAANRSKNVFLANMSHELRTPLNGIMGMTSLALRRAADTQQAEYLRKLEVSSIRLMGIINDVLDISRIEANRLSLANTRFDLSEVFAHVLDTFDEVACNKGLDLRFSGMEQVSQKTLLGDPIRLGQVLLNLVGNAIKFTDQGTVDVRLLPVIAEGAKLRLSFEVQDTGIGIRPENQTSVFLPFEQIDASTTRPYGGTGLGLFLCKQLIEQMGGTISVQSQPGIGSTFRFSVLVASVEEAIEGKASLMAEQNHSLLELQNQFHDATVLLVEDEPLNREVIRDLLESANLQVFVATDGVEAVEAAEQGLFDLILMDLKMPNMDGIEATYAIRAIKEHHHTPIVAVTANTFIEDREECIRAGMNDYISKPVTTALLFTVVLKWLKYARALKS